MPSVCDKISRADIQALLPAMVTGVTTSVGGGSNGGIVCVVETAGGVGLQVQTYPDDVNKSKFDYLLGNPSSAFNHAVSGIGDEAYYFEVTSGDAGTGLSSPNLVAHKGNATCGIESNDPPDTTLVTMPDGLGGFTATSSDVLAYVRLIGKVCDDVFAAE